MNLIIRTIRTMNLTNEEYQNILLKEFREEADFINNFYGLSDKDHFTAIELGHIYELMKEYKNSFITPIGYNRSN